MVVPETSTGRFWRLAFGAVSAASRQGKTNISILGR
jgi:hypothetical protein